MDDVPDECRQIRKLRPQAGGFSISRRRVLRRRRRSPAAPLIVASNLVDGWGRHDDLAAGFHASLAGDGGGRRLHDLSAAAGEELARIIHGPAT
jgi:hypothetical protein